ncbi:MAG: glycosyltransferase family 4 protein [Planctomycetota bacterium]|jgi:teichuronic acid biosynthesis glycosyltransferase TuaC
MSEFSVIVWTPEYPVPEDPTRSVFVHRQVLELREAGVECRVVVPRPDRSPMRSLVSRSWWRRQWKRRAQPPVMDGIDVEEVPYRRTWEDDEDVVPAMASSLVQFVEQVGRPTVVYAHWLWPMGASALLARESTGLPVAAIARGSELHDWQWRWPHCRTWVERVLDEVDLPLANCAFLRGLADKHLEGVSARMPVIYNGCDADRFAPPGDREGIRSGLGIDSSDRIAVFCGSLEERKGVPELLEAWTVFSDAHPSWQLMMLGGGGDDVVTAARSRRDHRSIRWLGSVSPEEVRRWMGAADAYLQPSRFEGLSNATMEAMATALPVVTTAVSGQPELVEHGENGWLLPAEDPSAIAAALAELASDPEEARRRGIAARRTIIERFDPSEQAARLAELLGNLASAGPTP